MIKHGEKKNKSKDHEKLGRARRHEDQKIINHAKSVKVFPHLKRYKLLMIVLSILSMAFLSMLILVDALPTDLMLTLVVVMLVLLLLSSILLASRKKGKRLIGIIVSLIFILIFSSITRFMYSTYAMLNKISVGGTSVTSQGPQAKSVDVTDIPFNIYITGIDQWASGKDLDLERSDVNMIVTVNPVTKEILLTSIPRDSYVELYTVGQMDKLTHTGIYGVEETLKTVEKWLDIDLNYYVKMNYTGARDIIDAMGGIDIYSPVEFESSIMGYKYYKGWNHLRGKKAVYFARERKAFEGQDSIRVENQQRVLKAMIDKMTSSTTLLTKYGSIMDAAGDNIQTNLSADDIQSLVKMQISEVASWNVQNQKVEGEYDEDYVASLTQSQKFSILRPDENSVKSCVNNIKSIMNRNNEDIEEINRERTRSFFINVGKHVLRNNKAEEETNE